MRQRRPFGEAPSGSLAVDELCCDINDFVRRCPPSGAELGRDEPGFQKGSQRRCVLSIRSANGKRMERSRAARPTHISSTLPPLQCYAGEPVKTPPADSVENMTVIDAIYRAAGPAERR
jgi:hypothetical protein